LTYVFTCPVCGLSEELPTRKPAVCMGPDEEHRHAPTRAKRDYRAENASLPTAKLKRWNHSRPEKPKA
jgi:hypothetical protein